MQVAERWVNPEREWALGLSQVEFENEYQRRFGPNIDCVPFGAEWVHAQSPKYHGITAPNPEDLVDDAMASQASVVEANRPKVEDGPLKCRGCGKEIKSKTGDPKHAKLGLGAHERKCKLALNLK